MFRSVFWILLHYSKYKYSGVLCVWDPRFSAEFGRILQNSAESSAERSAELAEFRRNSADSAEFGIFLKWSFFRFLKEKKEFFKMRNFSAEFRRITEFFKSIFTEFCRIPLNLLHIVYNHLVIKKNNYKINIFRFFLFK